jgi:hypothetical protein
MSFGRLRDKPRFRVGLPRGDRAALPGFHLICLGVVVLAWTGCAGYRLGPTNGAVAGGRSVEIKPFVNKTLEPRLSEYTMNSLRQNLIRDGTYRVDTRDEGDLIMTGVLMAYQRRELSLQPTDVLTVLDYEITLTAQITVRERSTGKLILDRPVKGRTSLRAGADLTSAERQAIPLLTDDLAKKTTALLVDGTW